MEAQKLRDHFYLQRKYYLVCNGLDAYANVYKTIRYCLGRRSRIRISGREDRIDKGPET